MSEVVRNVKRTTYSVGDDDRVDTTGLNEQRLEGDTFAVLTAIHKGEQVLVRIDETCPAEALERIGNQAGVQADALLLEELVDDSDHLRGKRVRELAQLLDVQSAPLGKTAGFRK